MLWLIIFIRNLIPNQNTKRVVLVRLILPFVINIKFKYKLKYNELMVKTSTKFIITLLGASTYLFIRLYDVRITHPGFSLKEWYVWLYFISSAISIYFTLSSFEGKSILRKIHFFLILIFSVHIMTNGMDYWSSTPMGWDDVYVAPLAKYLGTSLTPTTYEILLVLPYMFFWVLTYSGILFFIPYILIAAEFNPPTRGSSGTSSNLKEYDKAPVWKESEKARARMSCATCGSLEHAAVDCVTCYICGSHEHEQDECVTCNICGSHEHEQDDCTICSNCGSHEHSTYDCTTCNVCGSHEHESENCPNWHWN